MTQFLGWPQLATDGQGQFGVIELLLLVTSMNAHTEREGFPAVNGDFVLMTAWSVNIVRVCGRVAKRRIVYMLRRTIYGLILKRLLHVHDHTSMTIKLRTMGPLCDL